MADIDINWIYDDSVLFVKLNGDVNDDKFLQFDEEIAHYLDSSNAQQVHVVFDNSVMEKIPSLGVFKHLQFTEHPRLGWGVSYGDNDLTRFFMSTFRQVHWLYFHACQSYDDCLDFLQSMDTSLELDLSAS